MFMRYDSDFLSSLFFPFPLLLLYIFQFNSLSSLWQQYRAKRSQLGAPKREGWERGGWGGGKSGKGGRRGYISQFISLQSTSLSSSLKWNMKTVEAEEEEEEEEEEGE